MTALDMTPALITTVPGVAPRTGFTTSARVSSQAGLAALRFGFHPGEPQEGPVPDRDELPQREVGASLPPEDQAQLLANREHMRAAYEGEGQR